MSDFGEYFKFNNPQGVALDLSASTFTIPDSDDTGTIELMRGGAPGNQIPVANDVYASLGNLRFMTGAAGTSDGTIRFVGNHGDATLAISEYGATSEFNVLTLRFVRYPYAEIFSPGDGNGKLGPDWLQPQTACRWNSEAADLELYAGRSLTGDIPGKFEVSSRHGVGFWASGAGTIALQPCPGTPVPFEVLATGDLVTRGLASVLGRLRCEVNDDAAKTIGPLEGLKLPEVDYFDLDNVVWLVGTLAWLQGAPGQGEDESRLAVKAGEPASWLYVALT